MTDDTQEYPEPDSISVIGMSGRFPGAAGTTAFWANLMAGRSGVRPFTEEELAAVDPAVRRNPNFVPVVADVADVDLWDAAFFGFSPRIAELTDPQNRLFLECSWEALENAGYDPMGCPGVAGVVAGCGFPTYLMNNIFGHWDTMAEMGHLQLAIGNDRDALSTMVAYKLNLRGPSFTVQTSCSTSMVAVHLACTSLLTYESDVMLAGGVAIQSPQAEGYVYEEGGIASPDGVIRSLDAKGQGGVFGNGVGVVVLKRTADALRDGDQIYAQIIGSATNNDGLSRAGFAAPGLRGQSEVIAEALANAEVAPDTVSYVEAHGTGTLLGDAIELDAVSQAFQPRDPAAGPCAVGSVKPNIAHTDRASGVLGLIKTTLMLHHSRIPPQINFESPNAKLDTASGAFRVVTEAEKWPLGAGPRRAVVNSFGMGGTNAVAVLEEAPERAPREPAAPVPQVLVLSARSADALDEAARNLRDHLRAHPELDLADVAYTLQTGRTAFNHRRILACADVADAVAALSEPGAPRAHGRHQTFRHREVVVVVPGDRPTDAELAAAQALYEAEPVFRDALTEAAEAMGAAAAKVWEAPESGAVLRYALGKLVVSLGVPGRRFIGVGTGARVADCLAGTSPLTALRDTGDRPDDAELRKLAGDADLVLLELGDGRLLRAVATGAARDDDGSRVAALAASPAPAEVLVRELAGRLWLSGADPDWAAVHADGRRRRVALPTYPFERRRVWLDPAPGGLARPRSEERNEDIGQWFYAPVWRQAPRLVPAGLDTRLAEAGPWLVVATEATAPFAEALRGRLAVAGATADVLVESPAEPVSLGTLRPRVVLHTGAADDGVAENGVAENGVTGFDQAQWAGFDGVRRLVGELVRDGAADLPRILVLATKSAHVSGAGEVRPERAGLAGLARVIPQENPGLRCRVADIGAAPDLDALLADALDPGSADLAYHEGGRWQRDYEPFELPAPADGAVFRERGVYLLTGGLGQVCLAVAGHLADRYRARLALLTRTPLPAEDDWDAWLREHPAADPTGARICAVRALRAAGAEVLVLTADAADPAQVAAAVERVRAVFGEPHGVIHGAGIQSEEFFGLSHDLSVEQCREHYRAKLFGLRAIAGALDLDRLDFCVTLSSLATVLGAIGHSPYAAANAAMDGMADALFAAGHRRVLSVNWDSWPSATDGGEIGGATSTVAKYRMTYAEGIAALERALGAVGALPRLVNSTGDLRPRLEAWVDAGGLRQDAAGGDRHPRPPLPNPFVPAGDDIEKKVAEVWEEVMGLTGIGVLDNFFELGGHSLMAVRMIGKLRKSVGVNVPIAVLAECPTVRELADRIKILDPAAAGSDAKTRAAGSAG
ncbi:SDR family NAD(P)-dependent oxidoreductase [Amycolatopsis samaneae]|uniref:SDR family NAD(P)-dependent oxidoreductase n=1 Tax=Amycolatopsis samaneae TaxID=664691 RepID=A0ABW5GW36_9PSEU